MAECVQEGSGMAGLRLKRDDDKEDIEEEICRSRSIPTGRKSRIVV